MNWNELVARARQGDGTAWSELFDRTQSMVYYTALKLLKNETEAQDLAQDTYLKAMEHLGSLQEAEAFPGWIKRICVNLCKNHLVAKRPLLLGDDQQDFLMSLEPEVQEDFLPHAYADKMETCRLIDQMVDTLPDKQRATVVLYYYDELTVAQIAEYLQISENAVKSRLNYARSQIKRQVEDLEKKGTKLYSAAPLLALVLRNAAVEYRLPLPVASAIRSALELGAAAGGAAATGTATAGEAAAEVAGSVAAETAATAAGAAATAAGSTGTAAAAAAKVGLAAKIAAAGLGTKIAAGVAAAAILAGGVMGIRSATSGKQEAKRLAEAVESLGGPEQLLGMETEEITEALGEPTSWYENSFYYDFGDEYVLTVHTYDSSCQVVTTETKWIDPLGLDGADADQVEKTLKARGVSWNADKPLPEDEFPLSVENDGAFLYYIYDGPYCYIACGSKEGRVQAYFITDSHLKLLPEEEAVEEPVEEPIEEPEEETVDYEAAYAGVTGFPGTEARQLLADVTHDGAPELLVVSLGMEGSSEVSYLTVYTLRDS